MIDRQRLLRVANRPLQEQRNSDYNENSNNHVETRERLNSVSRRRTEDVEYWRNINGWFDDDVRMAEFNNGVYDKFYQIDDDGAQGSMFSGGAGSGNEMMALAIKVAAVTISLILCILMFRIITRRLGDSKKDKKKKKSASSSRSRSKSRSRSRSRARKKDSDYDLLHDDGEKSRRSTRSSRSKSRSRRSRSRSRARSHSRSRREKTTAPPAEPILV